MQHNQSHTFQIGLAHYAFKKPYYLIDSENRYYRAKVKGSTLGWNVNGKFVSYNKIKQNLCKHQG